MVQDDDTIKRNRKPATGNDETINLSPGEGKKQARNYKKRLDGKKTEIYLEWTEASTQSFFPFFLLTLIHPSMGV